MFSICFLHCSVFSSYPPKRASSGAEAERAAGSFRGRSHGSNRMSCGQVPHLAWSWCGRKLGRSCSVRRAEMAAGDALMSADFRRQCSWPADPVPLTGKGSEGGWRRLETIEVKAPFHCNWPIYSLSKYWD